MADPTIFERLKQDHDLHRQLIKDIDGAKGDRDARIDLFAHFKVEVSAHAAAEEESLYATMLANPDLREDAQHSVSEHKRIEDLLEKVEGATPESDAWEDSYKKLRHLYLHHIDEEEKEMFPDADKALSATKEQELAATFDKHKPDELERALKA